MKLTIRRHDDTAHLTLHGDLDALASAPLRQALDTFVEEGARVLELDMLRVRYLTSTGVSVLLAIGKRLEALGGRLDVVRASPGVRDAIAVLGFDEWLLAEDLREVA